MMVPKDCSTVLVLVELTSTIGLVHCDLLNSQTLQRIAVCHGMLIDTVCTF